MQQADTIKLKPFKNYYCQVLPCAVGEFYKLKEEDYKNLNMDEVKILCEYAIAKNVCAGVKDLYLKIPFFVDLSQTFERYGIVGKVILPALEINTLPAKALVSDQVILEIESFSDLSDQFLNELANFVGEWDIPVMLNLGDNLTEVGKVVNRFNMTPTELSESYGFLDRRCYIRGLNHVDKDDQALLKNYMAMLILSPRSDALQGKGFVNNYNLIYNDLMFGFGSGKCYNIDMLGEAKLSQQNTSNLLSEGEILNVDDLLKALSTDEGENEIEFDKDALWQTLLDHKVCIGQTPTELRNVTKEIVKRLKEKK